MSEFRRIRAAYDATFPLDDAAQDGFEKVVAEPMPGTAAYPVSIGVVRPPASETEPRFPYGGVMFIGHHADGTASNAARRRRGFANGDETGRMKFWAALEDLFNAAEKATPGLRVNAYFTNVYPALIQGTQATGRSNGPSDSPFARWCHDHLRFQIDVMAPQIIVAMGSDALKHVGLIAGWERTDRSAVRRSFNWTPPAKSSFSVPIVHVSHPSSWARLKNNAAIRSNGNRPWITRGHDDYEELIEAEAGLIRSALLK